MMFFFLMFFFGGKGKRKRKRSTNYYCFRFGQREQLQRMCRQVINTSRACLCFLRRDGRVWRFPNWFQKSLFCWGFPLFLPFLLTTCCRETRHGARPGVRVRACDWMTRRGMAWWGYGCLLTLWYPEQAELLPPEPDRVMILLCK